MSDYSETYEFLKDLSKGDTSNMQYSRWNYPNLIYDIKYNSQNPGSTIVYINFENDEEYLKVLNIDDDDDILFDNGEKVVHGCEILSCKYGFSASHCKFRSQKSSL